MPSRRVALAAVLVVSGGAAIGLLLRGDHVVGSTPGAGSGATSTPAATTAAPDAAVAPGSQAVGHGTDGPVPATPATTSPTFVATDPPLRTDAPEGGRAVDVVLTYVSWDQDDGVVEAGGYVTGLIEDGGTCTLTLTRGDASFSGTVAGVADRSTTACGQAVIPGGLLTSGDWQAKLSYTSAGGRGVSTAATVSVP